jgi:acetyltransferase-like isoleucine patch superfamily enzyme
MINADSLNGVETGDREVAATFGKREAREDPQWELDFAASLRETQSRDELAAQFGRFRNGEAGFDAVMRRILLRALCKRAGNGLQVGPGVVLTHPETMEFGDCVFIGALAMIQGRFDGTCKIGSHVWIGPQAYLDARALIIEDYVGWGPGAKLLGSTHTGTPVEMPVITTSLVIRPITVGYGADIGMNAGILPGVRLGANSIVGAGAVVTRDVPDYAVVAGVPAKIIRDRRDARTVAPCPDICQSSSSRPADQAGG